MPKDNHPPAMMLYFKDFFSDGKVDVMSTLEIGAYFRLLGKAWYEDPPGSIPNDDRVLAGWARLTPDAWAECRPGVLAAFSLGSDDRWHQKRMRKEFAKLVAKAKEKSDTATRAANARWMRQQCDRNADALPDDAIAPAFAFASSNKTNHPEKNPAVAAGGWDVWSVDSFAAAKLSLESVGYKRVPDLIGECREAGLAPRDIINAVDEFRANSGRFASPGAIAEKLRRGMWPVDNVLPVDQAKANNAKSKESSKKKIADSIRYRLVTSGVTEARNWSDEKVLANAKALEPASK